MRGSRYEVSTTGFDPSRQAIGSDPDGSPYNVGIRLPGPPTTGGVPNGQRFMIMLAQARFGGNRKARLVGMRQLITIGALINSVPGPPPTGTNYPVEFQIKTPFWSFTDGNVSWHLRRVPIMNIQTNNTNNTDTAQFQYSRTPAIMFQTGFVAGDVAAGYTAPFGGRIPGTSLTPELGNFPDIKGNWTSDTSWYSLDIEIEGPCDIALMASVKQTTPASRPVLVPPLPLFPGGSSNITPEDGFLLNFPTAQYFRIAGALAFEEEQFVAEPRGLEAAPSMTQQGVENGKLEIGSPMNPNTPIAHP